MSPEGMGYPQGGAAPPEAAAAPGGPEQAAPERGTEIAQVLGSLHQGLSTLAEAITSIPNAPPEAKQLAGNIAQQFQQLMGMLTGGNAQQPSAQPTATPPGTATPEAGAANVRPAQ
jgi:hypothetical protein